MFKYRIILNTWYQETPNIIHEEPLPDEFDSFEEAIGYLHEKIDELIEWFPVDSIKIDYYQTKIK